MNVNIVNETKTKLSDRRIKTAAQNVIDDLLANKIRNRKRLQTSSEVTLVFLTTAKMKKINHQYRGKNKATDVLSFGSEDADSLGEMAFCLGVLKNQAREQRHSLDRELLYMLIHGFLHLLGFDHEQSVRAEKEMFKLQDAIFERLSHIKTIL
ncbi:MAG: rRNA maturation RNase YbeY [Bdellovibrionaceae bacterium]|nr:rRNA maturation RNase YbeY [Bdellovibrio sp.]